MPLKGDDFSCSGFAGGDIEDQLTPDPLVSNRQIHAEHRREPSNEYR